jgi:hypothetical protein
MRFVLGPDKFAFHFNAIFNFNFKKLGLGGKELFRIVNPGIVSVRGISRNACCQPRIPVFANVAVLFNTVYSYKVILLGSTSSRMRNQPEE